MSRWRLPWPTVTTNHLWRHTARGVMLNPKARLWKDLAIIAVRDSGQELPTGDLAALILASPPKGWRGDADNLAKMILDSVFAAFGADDRAVADVRICRGPCVPKKQAHIVVILEPCRWQTLDEVTTDA